MTAYEVADAASQLLAAGNEVAARRVLDAARAEGVITADPLTLALICRKHAGRARRSAAHHPVIPHAA